MKFFDCLEAVKFHVHINCCNDVEIFSFISYMFEFFHVAEYTSFVTYLLHYIANFSKVIQIYIGILAINQELYLDTTMPMIKDPLYFFYHWSKLLIITSYN